MSVKVSVVMPVYNAAEFLPEALDSVLGQTLRDLEVVAVDDGSTDASVSILGAYAKQDARVRVIVQANAGPSPARNRAIADSRGEYIAMMDADDVATPGRLELEAAFLDAHPDHVAVSGQMAFVCTYGLPLEGVRCPTEHVEIERELLEGCGGAMPQPGLMVRATALRQIGGYDETQILGEDTDLCLRLAMVGKLANLNEIVVSYRQHATSLFHRRDPRNSKTLLAMLERARQARGLPPEGKVMDWIFNDPPSESWWLQRWAWNALRHRRRDIAWKHLRSAIRRAPFDKRNLRILACILRGR